MAGSKKGLSSKEDVLSHQEQDMILHTELSLRDTFIIYAFIYTGMRVSELAHLNRSWVNLDEKERTITIPPRQNCDCWECNYVNKRTGHCKEGIWKPKTKAGARTIRIHPDFLPIITEFFIYYEKLGITRQEIWYLIKRYAVKAKLSRHIYPHALRATNATNLAYKGISGAGLRYDMGWSQLSSAEAYVRSDRQRALKETDEIYAKDIKLVSE